MAAPDTRDAGAPIVVYGMSGYTGRLIAEYLTKRRLRFVAAGRNEQRLKEALERVPGEHDAQVREVRHEEEALTEAFRGARIVVNVTGPFGQLGEPVVRAALAAGCHYVDTTGEQDYAVDMRERYGSSFAERDLVFVSACAFMWTAGMIAAELALETPGVDSLDILYAPKALPTVASTLSFLRMCCLPQHYKLDGELVEWPTGTAVEVTVPGRHAVHVGLPWSGGFEPLWFQDDDRVRNCQVLTAFPKGPLVDFMRDRVNAYQELAQTRSREELEEVTNEWAMLVAAEPPKEAPEVNHTIVSCWARGATTGRHLVLHTTAPYLQTGALISEVCRRILDGRLRAVGFQPATAAFGHRELMTALAEDGLHCWTESPLGL